MKIKYSMQCELVAKAPFFLEETLGHIVLKITTMQFWF